MKKLFIILLLLFVVKNLFSKEIIHGTIINTDNGEPLPLTNIYIENTYIGTISNNEGQYSLGITEIPATIIVSYIGYETRKILIDASTKSQLDIALKPVVLQLKGISISADIEDPAIGIMKKVITNKKSWKNKLWSYQAKAYTRLKVENDSSIVSMSEAISKLYWNLEKGSREEFIAKKSAKRMSYLTELGVGVKNILNFYNDDIMMMNHKFVGPTHPDAFQYYDYQLIGERALNNQIVYDIKVIPKSILQPVFYGRISILDEDYAMIDVDLKNLENISFSTMFKYFMGHYRQQFSNFGKEFWLPIDSRTEEIFEVDMGVLAFPTAKLNRISRISNYEINVDVSDDIARIDSSKNSKTIRNLNDIDDFEKVPLTAAEMKAYTGPDTTMTLIKSFPPTGLLAGYMKSKEKDIEKSLSTHSDYTPYQSNSDFGFQAWYNRVEGFHLGLTYNNEFHDNFKIETNGGYLTYAKKFYYSTYLKYFIHKDEDKYLFAGYYDKIDPRYESGKYPQIITSLLPLLGKYDYFDYFSNKKFSTGLKWGIAHLNSEILFEMNSENHTSITKKTDWNLLNRDYKQRKNPPIDAGRINSIKLCYIYDEGFNLIEIARVAGLINLDKIECQIEHSSSKYLQSDFDYTQFKLLFDYTFDTFFKRRPDPNYLKTRFEVTTHTGEIPLQRFSIIDGNFVSYNPFGVFKTLPNRPIEGEKKVALFWEYNFMSVPFELLRLTYFARQKYELIIHGASGRTWINNGRLKTIIQQYRPSYRNNLLHEFGFGIRLKFTSFALRIDATRNMKNNKNYLGFSMHLISLSF